MRYLLACLCMCWNLAAWAQQAGKVEFVDGNVRVLDSAQKERTLKLGDAVNQGDTVVTGSDGELHLGMLDGGQLGIHSNTRMRIEQYKADGGKDDASVFNLLQGAMRSVTGWIGKYNARNYAIRTPTATIGVRGTDHETRVIPDGSTEGQPGTYDKVNAGATQMRTQFGTTDIRPNQAGFVGLGARSRPAVLARVPEFFRPMRNEKRFEGLHDQIRQRLDGLRQERVKRVADERFQRLHGAEGERRNLREDLRARGGPREMPNERRERIDQRRELRSEGLRRNDERVRGELPRLGRHEQGVEPGPRENVRERRELIGKRKGLDDAQPFERKPAGEGRHQEGLGRHLR